MKLKKVLILLIVLVLNYFIGLCQNNNTSILSKGDYIKADTTIGVPISIIRQANIKLLERKYYKQITIEQDTIINLKNKYILEQNNIIDTLQNRIVKIEKINSKLKEDYDKQRNKTIITGSILATTCICLITGLLFSIK